MRKYYKLFIILFIVFLSITSINAHAAIGYTYSHSGEPIYSTVGMSVTNDGIYTVISDNWKNSSGEQLPANEFTSPEDLFVYSEESGEDVIYVVDSASNNLFVFDGDVNYLYKVNQFEVRPEFFTEEELMKMKTRFHNGTTDTSISFADYLVKSGITIPEFLAIADIEYDDRTEDQKFYLSLYGVSGVYRSVRPERTEDGVVIKDAEEDLIYLCDKSNNQIVIVNAKTYHVVQVVSSPTDISFSGKIFSPVRVVTDVVGRMYVISEGVYEGIMFMSFNGSFSSFIGVNLVSLSFWETLWNRLKTEEQLASQELILNTIFTSLAIDYEGFIYATSRAIDGIDDSAMIKRINPSGKDVLIRNGYNVPKGDLVYIRTGTDQSVRGPSRFSAITVNDYGVYTVADEKSGRLFTYDDEGNLLYISGGRGNELDTLNNPVAIQYQGENIIALDKGKKTILRFEPTDIAVVINKAVKYHYEGNLIASSEEWNNVVAKNPNYEYAYVGIGKMLLNEERYVEAMSYFQTGYNVNYYSKAYKLYRQEQVEKYFEPIMTAVLILGVAGGVYYYISKRKHRIPEEEGDE